MGKLRKNFSKDNSGQVAVTFALMALPLLAVSSAAIDFTSVTQERQAIYGALDAAVLAAANNNAISVSQKGEYAESYFRSNYSGKVDLELFPSVTTDSVRLAAIGELNITIGKAIGIKNPSVNTASAATLQTERTICVLALSEDDGSSISFDSDMEFKANSCVVHSNSNSSRAIVAERNLFKPTASAFCAVGGVSGEVMPHSKGECSPIADPYKNVVPATIGTCKREFLLENATYSNTGSTTSGSSSDTGNPTSDTGTDLYGDANQNLGLLALSNDIQNGLNAYAQSSTDGAWANDLSATIDNAVNEYDNVSLPPVNPVSVNDMVLELQTRLADPNIGTADGPSNTNRTVIEQLLSITGDDLRNLLAGYGLYGESMDCKNNPQSSCYGYENPFLTAEPENVPLRSFVAEVFDISFGSYFNTSADVPAIVTSGIVELVDGQFYSRNNPDNELVPVSANLTGGNIVLTPGTYCGGLTVDGMRVRFMPGDYIFKDGPLTFLNQSEAHADYVTFGFTGSGATLNVETGSELTIRAPSYGPRKGLAFMQMLDPSAPGNRAKVEGVNRIASGGKVEMSGTAYFPEQKLMISGEDSHIGANSPAVGLIADIIEFRGERGSRVELNVDHVKAGVPAIEPRADDGVRLIE